MLPANPPWARLAEIAAMLTAVSTKLPVIPAWVHFVELPAILGVAIWRAGDEERLAAGYNLASTTVAFSLGAAFGFDPRLGVACSLVDAIFYTVLSLGSQRWWTLAAASVALASCATHVAQLSAHAELWAYGTARVIWFYGLSLVILVGAWTAKGASPGPPAGSASRQALS
jgi:hypothetical protein